MNSSKIDSNLVDQQILVTRFELNEHEYEHVDDLEVRQSRRIYTLLQHLLAHHAQSWLFP